MKQTHSNPRQPQRPQQSQRGFSLVEVLIALVIMSVGMLGIAGLYVQSLQAGRTSMFRHNAVTLVGDIADRIRANPLAGATYENTPGADNSCVALGSNCSADEMADHDIFLWGDQASDTLPNGRVTIAHTGPTNGAPPTYQITIAWDEPGLLTPPSYSVTVPVLAL